MNDDMSLNSQANKNSAKSNKFKSMAKTAENMEGQVMETAKKTYGELTERASKAFDGMNMNPTSYIQEHPMQAAIGGLVIGFLLGTAVSRRSVKS